MRTSRRAANRRSPSTAITRWPSGRPRWASSASPTRAEGGATVDGPWNPGWSGGRFQVKETAADVGVIAEGPSLSAAFSSAACGLYWIITPAAAADGGERASVKGEG